MKFAIVIVSTKPGSGRGGIATASESLLKMLDGALPVSTIISHDPDSKKAANIKTFFVSGIFLVFRVLSLRLQGFRPIIYLQVGPKGSLIRKICLAIVARMTFSTVVVHHHSPVFADYIASPGVMRVCLRALSALAARNFVLSEWWYELYVSAGIKRVYVIPNVVMEKVMNLADGERSGLITVSRLAKEKGVDLAISALAHLPTRFELSVAGDGPERNFLSQYASELNVASRVNFLGWVGGDQKSMLYKRASIFVLPSRYDSFGLVYLEALSAGCIVVAGPNHMVQSALSGLEGVFFSTDYSPESIAAAVMSAEAAALSPEVIAASVWKKYGAPVIKEDLLSCLKDIA